MNNILWKNKFIAINILALAIIKLGFASSPLNMIGLVSGTLPFSHSDVIAETNSFRTSLGLSQLKENKALNQAAKKKLNDMTVGQYFAHFSPSGTSPWYWFGASNYRYTYAGENLAFGFEDRKEMMAAWASSPSHRRNLVNSHYQDIGIAVGHANIGGIESIIVVQLFGTPTPAPSGSIAKATPTPTKLATPAPTRLATPTPTALPLSRIPIAAPGKITPLPTRTLLVSPVAVRGTETEKPAELPTLIVLPPRYDNILNVLNSGFAIYSTLLAIFALRMFLTATKRKELFGRVAVYGALCLAAILLSPIALTRTALIF